MSLIRQLIETNTIGVMAMCQAMIPQMRERRSGTIVNVTSSVTLGGVSARRGLYGVEGGHRGVLWLPCLSNSGISG